MEIKAKDMVLDFIQYIFLIVVSVFFFFYFFIGGRMEMAQKIVRAFMFISIFGALFIIQNKLNSQKRKKLKEEQRLDEIIAYLTNKDKLKDLIVVSVLPVLLYVIALINGYTTPVDIIQAITVFFISLALRAFLFRERSERVGIKYVTNFDITINLIVVFSLPIVVIVLSFFDGGADIIDIIQAGVIFIAMYYWHKYLFRRKEN